MWNAKEKLKLSNHLLRNIFSIGIEYFEWKRRSRGVGRVLVYFELGRGKSPRGPSSHTNEGWKALFEELARGPGWGPPPVFGEQTCGIIKPTSTRGGDVSSLIGSDVMGIPGRSQVYEGWYRSPRLCAYICIHAHAHTIPPPSFSSLRRFTLYLWFDISGLIAQGCECTPPSFKRILSNTFLFLIKRKAKDHFPLSRRYNSRKLRNTIS